MGLSSIFVFDVRLPDHYFAERVLHGFGVCPVCLCGSGYVAVFLHICNLMLVQFEVNCNQIITVRSCVLFHVHSALEEKGVENFMHSKQTNTFLLGYVSHFAQLRSRNEIFFNSLSN